MIRTIIASLLLTGCYSITKYPENSPQTVSKSTVTDTSVKVNWHNDVDSLQQVCKIPGHSVIYGCATVTIVGKTSICVINAIEPRDFRDAPLLAILGHEFWHCLGARHQ